MISSALVGTIMLGAIPIGIAPSGAAPAAADGRAQIEHVARRATCAGTPLNDSRGLASNRPDSYRLGNSDLPGRPRIGALRPFLVTGSTEPWPTPDPPLRTGLAVGAPPGAAGLPPLPTSAPMATAAQTPGKPDEAGGGAVDPGTPGAAESPPAAGRKPTSGARAKPAARSSARPHAARADLAPTMGWTEADKRSLIYSGMLALVLSTVGLAMVGWRRRQW
jgi:hypothetical protein